ncbi:MAG: tRNA (adenosine(37)-N6)-threonylcarbamoyltransferase complex ATPase subunit type 1 TsaE [Actinomycetota bacterium]
MLKLRSRSKVDTKAIAAELARLSRIDDVILLEGEMGAGKTVFAQGFGEALGVDEPVTSPTFNLVHTYDSGRIVLHHADLYRLDRTTEVSDLALGELVEGDGVLLIEWGEAAADILVDHLDIRLEPIVGADGESFGDERSITMTARGDSWTRRWPMLETALQPWICAAES